MGEKEWTFPKGIFLKPELIKDMLSEPTEYKNEILGKFMGSTCDVQDGRGNHCNGEGVNKIEFNGQETYLCGLCYDTYRHGGFKENKNHRGEPYIKPIYRGRHE